MGSTAVGEVVEGLAGSESGYLLPEMQRGEEVRAALPQDVESWAELGMPSVPFPLPEELSDQGGSGSVYALDRLNADAADDVGDQTPPDQPSTGSLFQLPELNLLA